MRALHNPMCSGNHCASEQGEVRVLPLGGSANQIYCRACYEHEMNYRRDRRRESDERAFPLPAWLDLEVYRRDEAQR